MLAKCYVCQSSKYVDGHHVDCQGGKLSPETVPFCRRCHRTYHDLGVGWFEDEYLDKILEIDNRYRALLGLSPRRREDIKRSEYYYKVHGIKVQKVPKASTYSTATIELPTIHAEPLCGWDWIRAHLHDEYPEPRMELLYDGELVATVTGSDKRGCVRGLLKGIKQGGQVR